MDTRKLVSLTLLCMCASMLSGVGAGPAEPSPGQTPLELVHSLADGVRRAWVGPPAERPSPFVADYRQHSWELLRELSRVPADEAVRLVREEKLSVLEGHLVEIAMALKERPTAWPALDVYYGMVRVTRALTPVSPEPMAAHLRPEFLHAWRWMMLCPRPEAYGEVMPQTASRALAQMNDTASLELMAMVFRWSFERTGHVSGIWINAALGAYPEDSRAEALKAAFRCWQYARSVVGQEVLQDTQRARTVSEEETQRVLDSIAAWFPKESVRQTLEKAEGDPEFAEFLGKVRDLQKPKAE